MTRRALILAVPQAIAQGDQWREYVEAANAFAERFNAGVLDVKRWRRVLKAIDRIEGSNCRGKA